MGISRRQCPLLGRLLRAGRSTSAEHGEGPKRCLGANISCADLPSVSAPMRPVYRVSLGLEVFGVPECEWTGDNRFCPFSP